MILAKARNPWRGGLLALGLVLAAMPAWAEQADFDGIDYDPPTSSLGQFILMLFNLDEVVETVAFFTCLLSIVVALLAITLSLRMFNWAGYSGLAAFGLIWIALQEQTMTGIEWTGLAVNGRDLIALGHVMAAANFVVSARNIAPGHDLARFRIWLWAGAILSLVAWPIGLMLSESQAMVLFSVCVATAGLSHILAFLTFQSLNGGPDRVLIRSGFVVLTMLIGIAALVTAGQFGAEVDIIFVVRLMILVVIVFLVALFIRHVMALSRDREVRIATSIEDAQREAAISRELLDTQTRYTETREIARMQRLRLATASHDIRQPITSLRNSVAALSQKQPAEVQEQLRNAFDYLESLASNYMEEARVGTPIADDAPNVEPPNPETATTVMLVETLDRMFRAEAEAKGLTFDTSADQAAILVQPLIVMRLLSNLVSNAIRHTSSGGVAVSASSVANQVRFSVTNSTDIASAEVETMFAAYTKGTASKGAGLGLAIVEQQAKEIGAELQVENSAPGRLTISISVEGSAGYRKP